MIQLVALFHFIVQLYSLSFNTIEGVSTSYQAFSGKKILIVNIATSSSKVHQIGELEQLRQIYNDSLVIIGFPSNSFGYESRSNAEINSFCRANYNCKFILAAKADVKGLNAQPTYQWIMNSSQNGVTSSNVVGDFQKYLIGKDGSLIGIYAPSVSPLDSTILDAINSN